MQLVSTAKLWVAVSLLMANVTNSTNYARSHSTKMVHKLHKEISCIAFSFLKGGQHITGVRLIYRLGILIHLMARKIGKG